jgi:hypothetical protein
MDALTLLSLMIFAGVLWGSARLSERLVLWLLSARGRARRRPR